MLNLCLRQYELNVQNFAVHHVEMENPDFQLVLRLVLNRTNLRTRWPIFDIFDAYNSPDILCSRSLLDGCSLLLCWVQNVNPSMEMVLQNKPHLEIKYSGSKFWMILLV